MTNNEAIKEIEKLDDWISTHPSLLNDWCKTSDALDMAIQALEQQPCEDCISRQAVLDLATTIETDDYSGNEILEVVEVKEIKNLPSVTPQPKIGRIEYGTDGNPYKLTISNGKEFEQEPQTGHWVDTGSGQMCSRCNEIQYGYDNFRRFCASCGAKMEVEE